MPKKKTTPMGKHTVTMTRELIDILADLRNGESIGAQIESILWKSNPVKAAAKRLNLKRSDRMPAGRPWPESR